MQNYDPARSLICITRKMSDASHGFRIYLSLEALDYGYRVGLDHGLLQVSLVSVG
jgi:hypothetical protein